MIRVPVEIAIRERDVPMEAVEEEIRERADRLSRFHDRVTSCRVAIEPPQGEGTSPTGVRARVELGVPPGHRLVATEEADGSPPRVAATTALKGAFDAIERQLRKLADRQSGHVKHHPERGNGTHTEPEGDEGPRE